MTGLVDIAGLDVNSAQRLLQTARELRDKVQQQGNLQVLSGRTVALLFLEPSTRTRCSFEMAAVRLGAYPLVLQGGNTSAKKGETVLDTARLLAAVGADALVVRHGRNGTASALQQALSIPVFNAGDGTNEHPTQALLDALTLTDHLGDLTAKTIAIVGDVRHSRVARSNCLLLPMLGAKVVLSGPPALCPQDVDQPGVSVAAEFDDALRGADAVMMLRIQKERLGPGLLPDDATYVREWQLDRARLDRHHSVRVVLHPAPMNRGVEITSDVADGPKSAVFEQMRNGVFVRMAALLLAMSST